MKYITGVLIAVLMAFDVAAARQRAGDEVSLERFASLQAAISEIGVNQRTVVINNTQAVAASLTIPNNVALRVTGDGKLNVSAGATLTIGGPFDAPLRQVFTGPGSVRFGADIQSAYPQWFGAAMNNSTDDQPAIQKAIDAFALAGSYQSAGVVEITGGAAIGSTVRIADNAVTLRGQGWGSSINGQSRSFLRWIGAAGNPMILINDTWGARVENIRLIGSTAAKASAAVEIRDTSRVHAQDLCSLSNVYIGHMFGYDVDYSAHQFTTGILLSGKVNGDSNRFEHVQIVGCDTALDIDNPNASYTAIDGMYIGDCTRGVRACADLEITNLLFGVVGTEVIIDYPNVYVQITGYGSEGGGRLAKLSAPGGSLIIRGGSWQVGPTFKPADSGGDRWVIDAEGFSSTIRLENFDFMAFGPGANHVIRVGNSGGSHTTVLRCIDVTGLTTRNIKVLPDPLPFVNAGAVIELVTRNTSGVMSPLHSRVLLDANRDEDRSLQHPRTDIAGKLNNYGGPLKVKRLIKPGGVTATATGSGGATYSYRVTALTYDGETDVSAAATCRNAAALNATTNFNTVTWHQSQGAYAYRIYGRTSGSEQLLVTLTLADLTRADDHPNWKDDGSARPDGAQPAGNTTGNLTVEGTLVVGGGAPIAQVLKATATLNFPITQAQTGSDLTITVAGAAVGDVVALGVPHESVAPNSSFTAWVSAKDTVNVRFNNYSSRAIDPPAASFTAMVTKF
ncbi:MAG TPA: hypothetical protein VKA70_05780 [Blastocatellia bacterium]|nr:hypothetical protein [Blastocatellia bacterium]